MASTPSIHVTHKDARTIKFELRNASTALANALRRVMIAEVPTMAFEHIDIRQNTSPLPDEYIAHRIGLIPLKSDNVLQYYFREDCQCEAGCPKCTVYYMLNVTCESGVREVTSKDLHLWYNPSMKAEFPQYIEYAETVKPVELPAQDDDIQPIIIAKLSAGQSIQLLAKAEKNIGRVHAKWSPVCVATYIQPPHITLGDLSTFSKSERDDFVKTCPANVFTHKATDSAVEVTNESACIQCIQCVEFLEEHAKTDLIDISVDPDTFLFEVETIGSLKPEFVVQTAFQILSNKMKSLLESVKQVPVTTQ